MRDSSERFASDMRSSVYTRKLIMGVPGSKGQRENIMLVTPDGACACRKLRIIYIGGEPLVPGRVSHKFSLHIECMDEGYEYANEFGKEGSCANNLKA